MQGVILYNRGAVKLRIECWGMVDYNYNKEPPKTQTSTSSGACSGPCSRCLVFLGFRLWVRGYGI